jgi:hypothetical protein
MPRATGLDALELSTDDPAASAGGVVRAGVAGLVPVGLVFVAEPAPTALLVWPEPVAGGDDEPEGAPGLPLPAEPVLPGPEVVVAVPPAGVVVVVVVEAAFPAVVVDPGPVVVVDRLVVLLAGAVVGGAGVGGVVAGGAVVGGAVVGGAGGLVVAVVGGGAVVVGVGGNVVVVGGAVVVVVVGAAVVGGAVVGGAMVDVVAATVLGGNGRSADVVVVVPWRRSGWTRAAPGPRTEPIKVAPPEPAPAPMATVTATTAPASADVHQTRPRSVVSGKGDLQRSLPREHGTHRPTGDVERGGTLPDRVRTREPGPGG